MNLLRSILIMCLAFFTAACQTSDGKSSFDVSGRNLGAKNWRDISQLESRILVKLTPGDIHLWQVNELSSRRQEKVRTRLGNIYYSYYHGLGGYSEPSSTDHLEHWLTKGQKNPLVFEKIERQIVKNGIAFRLYGANQAQKCAMIIVYINEPGENDWASRSRQYYKAGLRVISCSKDKDAEAVKSANEMLYHAVTLDGGPRNRPGV